MNSDAKRLEMYENMIVYIKNKKPDLERMIGSVFWNIYEEYYLRLLELELRASKIIMEGI